MAIDPQAILAALRERYPAFDWTHAEAKGLGHNESTEGDDTTDHWWTGRIGKVALGVWYTTNRGVTPQPGQEPTNPRPGLSACVELQNDNRQDFYDPAEVVLFATGAVNDTSPHTAVSLASEAVSRWQYAVWGADNLKSAAEAADLV